MKKYILEIAVFISGAVVMIYEIVGSRVLAPYLGTSIFVWTSLIGVILASLSLGYYYGGRIADKYAEYKYFALVLFLSAIAIGFCALLKEIILGFINEFNIDLRLSATIAAIILFAPASILLGMISPYAVKLKMNDLKASGSTVGRLYAISTVGSIVGTFIAGFFLIAFIGTTKILYLLGIIMVLVSLFACVKHYKWKIAAIVVLLFCIFAHQQWQIYAKSLNFVDVDTLYNRVWIVNAPDSYTNKLAKFMYISGENSSAMFIDSDELAFEYSKYYRLANCFVPEIKSALMIGGAAYSYPKDFLKEYKAAQMDVVEIDPGLTELARKYFKLEDNSRLDIYHEDGRTFLNNNQKKYNVIYGDAFKSVYTLPYHLTTKESVQKIADSLADKGIALVNIISAIESDKGKFLRAEYATFKSVFPQVKLFPVMDAKQGNLVQNIMLIAFKDGNDAQASCGAPILKEYLSHEWEKEVAEDMPIITDELAPVDHYTLEMIKKL